MPVFDATQNQVLFSPVSNYYKGKAIRQQLAAGEQDQELKGLQIDLAKQEIADAPARKKQEAELYDLKFRQAKEALAASEMENGRESLDFMAKSLSPLLAKATETAIGGDAEAAAATFNEDIQRIKSTFPPAIAEQVKSGAGEDGVYQPEEIGNMKMMLGAWLEREGEDRTQAKFLVDGKEFQGSFDKAGNYFYSDGSPAIGKIQPFGLGRTENDPSQSGVNPSGISKNTVDFQNGVVGAVGAVQTGTELLTTSATNPEALGVAGGFMRWGSNFVSGAQAIADWAGYDKLSQEDTMLQTVGSAAFNYDSVDTDKLGVSGAEAEKFRAGVYGIAFAAAVAEQGTRPTDKDIQQFIDQIGGRATSAQSFRETIFQFMRRQDRRLKTIADVKGISEVDRDAAFKAWTPAFQKFVETYADTSGRKRATDPETGVRYIEITPGNWEEF